MDVFASIGGWGSSALAWIVPFLFVLTVIVFFHELGHFLVARWCGVTVKVFSLGFGPELAGFTDRKGTRWRISAIPLGGYVKFLGDENEASIPDHAALAEMSEEERGRSFFGKGVLARAAIIAAGPAANFLLAIAIFTAVFSLYGRQVTTPRADVVVAGSAAEAAGIRPGDLVVSIDGRPVETFADLQRIVSVNPGVELTLVVERDGEEVVLHATPERQEVTDNFGNTQRIGILGIQRSMTEADLTTERYSVPEAAGLAVSETWFIVERTLSYLAGVVTGQESTDQLGGPIRIAEISAQVASISFVALINLAAVLSVSIGLVNLFPIPILDGGHLLFYAIEAIRGRPLSERAQDIGLRIGFVAVVMLMIFATWNDIVHLG